MASNPPELTQRNRLRRVALAAGFALPLVMGLCLQADRETASLGGIEGPPCPLGELAGEACCPGCGLTRSTTLVMHGDFGSAFSIHPAGFVVVVLCAVGLGVSVLRLRGGRDPRWLPNLRRWGFRAFAGGLGVGWACKLLCSLC